MLSTLARSSRLRSQVTWTPLDSRWYQAIGGNRSDAGLTVLPESALGIAVVYRAVNVLAHSIASIPLVIYRRLDDDGKEKAKTHPQYDLLHDKPNAWMTSFRWRHLMMVQAVLWGDHYSEIIPGAGSIGQLVPLNPDTTRIVDQLADGRLLYVTRDQLERGFGPERKIIQDELLHIRGFSIDGKRGIPLTRLARNAMGLALAAEKHGSMFMRKGATFAGILSTEGDLSDEARKKNEAAWQKARGGPDGSGTTPILTNGMKFSQMSSSNKDSQWLESRTFQVEDLLRFLGVPGVLCGYADKTATYASAEQFFLSYVTHTLRPWTENISAELNNSVVTGGNQFFADFILEGLLRGDIKTRYSAHQIAVNSGWKTRNEVRLEENMNRGPDALDRFLEPLNMVDAEDPRDPAPRNQNASEDTGDPEDDATNARLAAIARAAATRLVRRETAAIAGTPGKMGAAKRLAAEPARWKEWLADFYSKHAETVAQELGVTADQAKLYCEGRLFLIKTNGIAALESFESVSVQSLINLAIKGSVEE